ncbi:hypothetical protein LBMAG33_4040 [Candidatus Levyibacteriota bacterium]|nr:tetratricopeptide repeat protein [Candidatus Levybacteria bacterium]GDX62094.1 hypothetical protein LBMAG33_4040 [Candidatus Levybacteria bacterium]
MSSIKNQAIETALTGNWEKAIALNQELLKDNPQDTEALNRLAFALNAKRETKEAKKIYQQVLEIDMLNKIAIRGLKRISDSWNNEIDINNTYPIITSNLFIEETGKTKVIELIHTEQKITSSLHIGERVLLSIKRLKIFIHDDKKRYAGTIPDNIGKRLVKLLSGGNIYEAFVKSLENNHITVFIREIKRSDKFLNQPSFINDQKKFVLQKNTTPILKKKSKKIEEDIEEDYSEEVDEVL